MIRFFLLVILSGLFTAFLPGQENSNILDIKKNFKKVRGGFYMSRYETTNKEYREFLDFLQASGQKELYTSCLPDTNSWAQQNGDNVTYVSYYFRHKAYDNYPVVGITYAAANAYCAWLTQAYKNGGDKSAGKVRFGLPSKEEWVFAAGAGDTSKNFPWGRGFIKNNRGEALCNYRHVNLIFDSAAKKYIETNEVAIADDRRQITSPVNAFFPNDFGLYNLSGNAAEMVREEGVTKGGSYNDPPYLVMIQSEKKYSAPSAEIGFRVAMYR
ncbi:MAG: SUMF1/EgtB/PvdO family nonheme iron enzyme [Ferruginibacter sp.]